MKFEWTMRKKIVAAILVLAATTGAECGSKSPSDPNPDPGIKVEEPYIHLQTFADEEIAPYHVTVNIQGGDGLFPKDKIPVAAGVWQHDVPYRSGTKLFFTLQIIASKRGPSDGKQHGYCRIVDGAKVIELPIYNTNIQTCQHTTQR